MRTGWTERESMTGEDAEVGGENMSVSKVRSATAGVKMRRRRGDGLVCCLLKKVGRSRGTRSARVHSTSKGGIRRGKVNERSTTLTSSARFRSCRPAQIRSKHRDQPTAYCMHKRTHAPVVSMFVYVV